MQHENLLQCEAIAAHNTAESTVVIGAGSTGHWFSTDMACIPNRVYKVVALASDYQSLWLNWELLFHALCESHLDTRKYWKSVTKALYHFMPVIYRKKCLRFAKSKIKAFI